MARVCRHPPRRDGRREVTAIALEVPPLRDYQRVAIAHLQANHHAGLMLDMGLGKTRTVLEALTPDRLPALVIAPRRVAKEVWPAESKLWTPHLRVVHVTGSPAQREALLQQPADVYVLGRDNLRAHVGKESVGRYRTLVIDELSGFKARSSVRWRAARKLLKDKGIRYVWGLTGTPSPNGLLDLWAQLYLLDGGVRLGSTLGEYRRRYFTPGHQLPNGVITEWNLRPGAAARIHKLIDDICLSMTTDGRVELPPVTFNNISVPLTPKIHKVYRDMKDTLVSDLSLIGGSLHSAANAAVLSGRLCQITAGFMYHDDAPDEVVFDQLHTEKIKALQEIIDSNSGSPVLVFYRFRAEVTMVKRNLDAKVHTIDEPDIFTRWNAGKIPVLLAHPASIGHGLNLQHGGHTIVWLSLPWSLEEWQQSNKRLARSGQKHPVVIHRLLSPKTVDVTVARALKNKTSVQDALIDHLESPL